MLLHEKHRMRAANNPGDKVIDLFKKIFSQAEKSSQAASFRQIINSMVIHY